MASPSWQPLALHATGALPAATGPPLFVAEVSATGIVEHASGTEDPAALFGTPVPPGVYGALLGLGEAPQVLAEPWGRLPVVGLRHPAGGFLVFGAPGPDTPFEALVAQMPALVLHLEGDEGFVRYANQEARSMLRVEPEALLGVAFWEAYVYPEDRWKLTPAFAELATAERAETSVRLRRPSGELRLATVHLRTLERGTGAVLFDLTEQSEMVDALHHSEALYDTFLEQSPVGLIHLDAAGTVTFENFRFRQIVGEEPDDAWIGRSAFAISGTDSLFSSGVKRLLSGQQVTGFDIRFAPPGRPPNRLLLNGAPIRQEDGNVVGAVLMFQDVTQERTQAEEVALRDRFARAESALRETVFAHEAEATFLREAARIIGAATETQRVALFLPSGDDVGGFVPRVRWGAAPEAFDGRTLTVTLPEAEEAIAQRAPVMLPVLLPASTEPGAPPPAREALLAPFFEREGLQGFVVAERTEPGEPLLGGLRLRLVTDLVRVFETLLAWLRSSERFRLTVSTIEDGLFNYVLDAHGHRRYLFLTPQVQHLTGQRAEAFLETPGLWEGLVGDAESRAALAAHAERLRQGLQSEVTYTLDALDGATRTVRERATPFRSDDGALSVTGIFSDVTEQEQARAVLVNAKLAAEQASRDKTAFIQTLSHELRTPIGALSGFAELLEHEINELPGEVSPQIAEFAATIRERARATLALVNDLFELSSFDSHAIEVKRVPTPLDTLTRRVAEQALQKARTGVELRLDLAPVTAVADPARLEQVVQNLLSNAFKFTHTGAVTVSTRRDGDQAVLEVRDTGVGISETYMQRLFTPFEQEDQRLNRDYEGTGLGLALVKRLVDLMGGTVEARSVKGAGTTFCVYLPTAEA